MQIERENAVFTLTPEELEEAYREKELEYRIQDAKNHIAEFCAENNCDENWWTEKDIRKIAECFMKGYDCNMPENALFHGIIESVYLNRI